MLVSITPLPSQAENGIEADVPNKPLAHPESASAELDKVQSDFAESLNEDEAERSSTTPAKTFAFIAAVSFQL